MPEQLRQSKKLIVLCDGTWQNSDVGWEKAGIFETGHPQTPSNVTRLARAILPEDKQHNPQIVFYQAGLGSGWSLTDQLLGGGLALGLTENIRQAYGFLAHNYSHPDDQIFLIGFSRGAFTARSVGGIISALGLLNKIAMQYFYDIFQDYENAGLESYTPKLPNTLKGFEIKVPPSPPDRYMKAYRAELLKHGLTREAKIQAIGVWDTVGTLGLPVVPLLQKVGFPTALHKYRFLDTGISSHVLNAFQALALDEERSAFQPTVWERKEGNTTTNLTQVWFPGVHSNIGGGYPDSGIADLTLAWMMSQLKDFLHFDKKYLWKQITANKEQAGGQTEWQWGMGALYNSFKFPTSLAGSVTRKPGFYPVLEYPSGKPTPAGTLLRDTNEYVHASVRARINFGGKDYSGNPYNPAALQGWELKSDRRSDGTEAMTWVHGKKDQAPNGKIMEEAPLGEYEKRVLDMDPKMEINLFF